MATTTAQTAAPSAERRPFPWGKVLAWIVLLLLIAITLFPIWIVIKTAFSSQRSLFGAAESLLPSDPTVFNFRRALGLVSLDEMVAAGGSGQTLNFPLYLRNSVLFTGVVVVCQIFFSALGSPLEVNTEQRCEAILGSASVVKSIELE